MRARECCWLWLRPWLRSLSGALRASPAVRPKAHQLQRCSMIGGGPLASSRVLPRWDGWMNGCHDSDQTTTTTTNASIGAGLLPRPFCCRSGLLIFVFLFSFYPLFAKKISSSDCTLLFSSRFTATFSIKIQTSAYERATDRWVDLLLRDGCRGAGFLCPLRLGDVEGVEEHVSKVAGNVVGRGRPPC